MPDVGKTIQPSTVDKLVGGATFLATNGATVVAPILSGPSHPNMGGMAVSSFALFINAVIQQLKKHEWYKQDSLAIWTGVVLAGYLCVLVWIVDDPSAALVNFTNVVGLVLTNYGSMSKTGVIAATGNSVVPSLDAVPQPTPPTT